MAADLSKLAGFRGMMIEANSNPTTLEFLQLHTVEITPPNPGGCVDGVLAPAGHTRFTPYVGRPGKVIVELEIDDDTGDVDIDKMVGSLVSALSKTGVRIP